MRDKALDFGRAEVREYTFRLVDELASRYDFDGLELDWMRHGFHFAPGREQEGAQHLNRFMERVRRRLGKRRKIGVRVPPRPESALRLGLDAVEWARAGCVDLVTPTNFWRTVDTGMPLRLWRRLLPPGCLLGAGLELGLNSFAGSRTFEDRPFGYNTLATVRGAAAAYLEQGAGRVYLFNYMDAQTAIEDPGEYPALLRSAGALATLAGQTRRHIVTYTDTWAPGEAVASLLPARLAAGAWRAFRLASGPLDSTLRPVLRLGVEGDASTWKVFVNTMPAAFAGPGRVERPWPKCPVYTYSLPAASMRAGETVIDVCASTPGAVEWVELALTGRA
jgi:hypothetical protein